MIKTEKASKVYTCCGQYIALTPDIKPASVKCPRCNKLVSGALKVPLIVIVSKK